MTRWRKMGWIGILYFAEGMPFGIVKDVWPVYFRLHGISLTDIGLMSLLGLPWTLKVFWSPLVDRFGQRTQWIVGCLTALCVLTAMIPCFDPQAMTWTFWILLVAFTVAAATQDVAIDAYSVGIVERGEEGDANGIRVSTYRVALIVTGGGLVVLSQWMSWSALYYVAAGIFALLAMTVMFAPRPPQSRTSTELFAPMRDWLLRPGVVAVAVFILLYKLGDASMGPMVKPFWLDSGLTAAEIGLVSTSFGMAATIAGALIGGRMTSAWGIFHALWMLGLAQAISNLGYATVALVGPPPPQVTVSSLGDVFVGLQEPARAMIYTASMIESFCSGLGSAAFMSFLMNICEKQHAAVQYALLSALFAFSRDVAGAASGWATTRLGYGSYFVLTFALSFPALLLLPFARSWIREAPPSSPSAPASH